MSDLQTPIEPVTYHVPKHRKLWLTFTILATILGGISTLVLLVGMAFLGGDQEAGGTTPLQVLIWAGITSIFIAGAVYGRSHVREKKYE